MTNLFQKGKFKLRSGRESTFKLECDALIPQDWEGVAAMAAQILSAKGVTFREVLGVPQGGIPFANAMKEYTTPGSPNVLICEDVWTTGGSIRRFIEANVNCDVSVHGVVLFARGAVDPLWCTAVCQLPKELWAS